MAMDHKISEVTGGNKSIDDLLALLGQRYGKEKQRFYREDMLSALKEVTGQNLSDFYMMYFSEEVSPELPPVDNYMSEYLGHFKKWLDYQLTSQTYMNWAKGFRTMFLVDLEISLFSPVGYGTDEHSAATASGLYKLDGFRKVIGDSKSITKEKVIATLSSLTGVDHSDFFEFYTSMGVTPSVSEIIAWLNNETACNVTLSSGSDGFDSKSATGVVSVTTSPSSCTWTSVSNNSWVTITSGDSGSGNSMVSYTISANNGPARTGTITIGGQIFTVTQNAPVYNLKGDLDNDGTITMADAIIALQVMAEMQPSALRSDYSTANTDVSGDGKVGMSELFYILQKVVGTRQ